MPAGAVVDLVPVQPPAAITAWLPMMMETQQAEHWCWAAVARSAGGFLGRSVATQCQIADFTLIRAGHIEGQVCCNGGPCDLPFRLTDALASVSCWACWIDGQLYLDHFVAELEAGLPVPIRVDPGDDEGHFLMVSGIHRDQQMDVLFVLDPYTAAGAEGSWIHADDLRSGYEQVGRWTDTYVVR